MRTTWCFALMLAARTALAQPDPLVGDWRGTLKAPSAAGTPIVFTISRNGDAYGGFTSGLNEGSEVALERVIVSGDRVAVEATADSKLGRVVLAADLTLAGNALT